MAQSIGVVGCGSIGQALMRAADSGKLNVAVAGVTSRDEHRAHEFLGTLDNPGIIEEARETGCRLLAPSGAIAGLDGIKSACAGWVDHVTMVSRKPPISLEGAPHLVENGISLEGLEEELEVFSGTAREAVKGFPANLNVSAAVSLAGVGPDRTMVTMIAVPGLERNCHDIEVEGEFGVLRVHIENIPSENPKTGKLTAFSIIRSVQDALDPFRIGT